MHKDIVNWAYEVAAAATDGEQQSSSNEKGEVEREKKMDHFSSVVVS